MTLSAHYLSELEATRAETLRHFELTGDALERSYGPGKWTVRYLLHHLADAESVLFYRIRRVISEPRQVIWAYDQDLWAAVLDYATVPLALSRALYTASRDGIAHYAERHYERAADVFFVHSETGARSLKDEFDKVVAHNRQHLDHIAQSLASPS